MTLARFLISLANRVLAPLHLRLDSLTKERQDKDRIRQAAERGDFGRALYPVPESFASRHFTDLLAALPKYAERFATFQEAGKNDVAFEYDNGFFSSPDVEVLYTLVRETRPSRIAEIGCGNSTKIIHQAILDGGIDCRHTCIDPQPRRDISGLADTILTVPIESCDPGEITGKLTSGDILFIDTSHEVAPANDVAFIYARLLPLVRAGVLIHIHDIFLPFEYPIEWVRDLGLAWAEQYLVQVMLMNADQWKVLWPGYYLQRTQPDFAAHFPNARARRAQSLWITKRNPRES